MPLVSTKSSGSRHKKDSLLPVIHGDVEPAFMRIRHMGGELRARDLFVSVIVSPAHRE
jgi:hypothetical protein